MQDDLFFTDGDEISVDKVDLIFLAVDDKKSTYQRFLFYFVGKQLKREFTEPKKLKNWNKWRRVSGKLSNEIEKSEENQDLKKFYFILLRLIM